MIDNSLRRMPETTELSIFRIAQEGLNNVWRHANATSVTINLQHTSPRTLLLSIEDNGQGFSDEIDLANSVKGWTLWTARHQRTCCLPERENAPDEPTKRRFPASS